VSEADGALPLGQLDVRVFARGRAFAEGWWCVQIRGRSGERSRTCPCICTTSGAASEMKIPTELLFDETLELTCANHGFCAEPVRES
jgi:predicted component of type VI protein secretion system